MIVVGRGWRDLIMSSFVGHAHEYHWPFTQAGWRENGHQFGPVWHHRLKALCGAAGGRENIDRKSLALVSRPLVKCNTHGMLLPVRFPAFPLPVLLTSGTCAPHDLAAQCCFCRPACFTFDKCAADLFPYVMNTNFS